MSHDHKTFKDVCKFLGCDLDSEPCQTIRVHLEQCHNCEVFVDRVKQTVSLYRKIDSCNQELPEDVSRRLYKVLHLKNPHSIRNLTDVESDTCGPQDT
jgi:predicted anti-sigma-YlaC factor YlaD